VAYSRYWGNVYILAVEPEGRESFKTWIQIEDYIYSLIKMGLNYLRRGLD
jgi:hypothetical protein